MKLNTTRVYRIKSGLFKKMLGIEGEIKSIRLDKESTDSIDTWIITTYGDE